MSDFAVFSPITEVPISGSVRYSPLRISTRAQRARLYSWKQVGGHWQISRQWRGELRNLSVLPWNVPNLRKRLDWKHRDSGIMCTGRDIGRQRWLLPDQQRCIVTVFWARYILPIQGESPRIWRDVHFYSRPSNTVCAGERFRVYFIRLYPPA